MVLERLSSAFGKQKGLSEQPLLGPEDDDTDSFGRWGPVPAADDRRLVNHPSDDTEGINWRHFRYLMAQFIGQNEASISVIGEGKSLYPISMCTKRTSPYHRLHEQDCWDYMSVMERVLADAQQHALAKMDVGPHAFGVHRYPELSGAAAANLVGMAEESKIVLWRRPGLLMLAPPDEYVLTSRTVCFYCRRQGVTEDLVQQLAEHLHMMVEGRRRRLARREMLAWADKFGQRVPDEAVDRLNNDYMKRYGKAIA